METRHEYSARKAGNQENHEEARVGPAGRRPFTFKPSQKVALGQNVTATATKNSTRDTSEFSAPRKVVAP
jgi:hypothetical protein